MLGSNECASRWSTCINRTIRDLDAPPLLPVTDALVLAPLTDGVMMVINYGGTRIGEAVQGKTQLDQSGARMLGVVMNKIPTGAARLRLLLLPPVL